MPTATSGRNSRLGPGHATRPGTADVLSRFPSTRYQGSKRKLAGAILHLIRDLEYTTVLDAFGGTGSMAYAFKRIGKEVTYNDVLPFNLQVGRALIENDGTTLIESEIRSLGERRPRATYDDVIERTFEGIYFHAAENRWLDIAAANIGRLRCRYKRALAWYAVFQAALAKRPYNLFHRRNLYMRTANVPRGFGNKATWERSFDAHFRTFIAEANAAVFAGTRPCRAVCRDAAGVGGDFDLVYLDPPYLNARGVGVDYAGFYHFLNGLVQYDRWPQLVDYQSKHRRLDTQRSPWSDGQRFCRAFLEIIDRFRRSQIVVSYRSDGIPGPLELTGMLKQFKKTVQLRTIRPYRYALSAAKDVSEVLLICT